MLEAEILRYLADPDEEVAAAALDEFATSIWHQGTVFPEAVAAVPALVELATTPGVHQRAHLLHVLGAMSDPAHSRGDDLPAVRAALAEHAGWLLPLLGDHDPGIREHAAFALVSAPGVTAQVLAGLEERWATETDPRVRSSLLMGLARLDPRSAGPKLRTAAVEEKFPMPVAAALALTRAGLRLPAETIRPIADALAADEQWDSPWTDRDPLAELLATVDRASADALTAAMTKPARRSRFAGPRARRRAAAALRESFVTSRSAPIRMMPQLRMYLTDPDADVRAAAATTAGWAGTAAAAVAEELLPFAFGVYDDLRYSPAQFSLVTLIRLGVQRWREPLMAAWAAGADPWGVRLLAASPPPFDHELFEAARQRLAARPTSEVISLLGSWGAAAAGAVPEIAAALVAEPAAVCAALGNIGAAAGDAASELLRALHRGIDEPLPGMIRWPDAEGTRFRAAHALWRVTGETEPLLRTSHDLLAFNGGTAGGWELTRMADLGPAAAPLLPVVSAVAAQSPDPNSRVGAARVLWRATGDPEQALPTVEEMLRSGDSHARAAAELAADLTTADPTAAVPTAAVPSTAGLLAAAPEAGRLTVDSPAARGLISALRAALGAEWAQLAAARALWHLGTEPADLVKPLFSAMTTSIDASDRVRLIVEMGATGAVESLTRLAEQDERIFGDTDDTVWRDDRLRRDLFEAVTALTNRRPAHP
ncbi:hypothetical protein AB0M02_23440 [Actinoplanes sp. NPDC051861]|uniref:hypothetical protein n=1 Tax=Actinoplanes sp. NPDC051861 TaxID=3155170 RepID=UPI003438515B